VLDSAHDAKVSIHAPPNRKERLTSLLLVLPLTMFQSTPLPTGRSDHQVKASYWFWFMFQSTPLPTGRSDNAHGVPS